MFGAAYQAYACSMWMRMAGQDKKAEFLRWYSTKLMNHHNVRSMGKNWNDVNFPAGSEALMKADQTSIERGVSKETAAKQLLETEQCRELNAFAENAVK